MFTLGLVFLLYVWYFYSVFGIVTLCLVLLLWSYVFLISTLCLISFLSFLLVRFPNMCQSQLGEIFSPFSSSLLRQVWKMSSYSIFCVFLKSKIRIVLVCQIVCFSENLWFNRKPSLLKTFLRPVSKTTIEKSDRNRNEFAPTLNWVRSGRYPFAMAFKEAIYFSPPLSFASMDKARST